MGLRKVKIGAAVLAMGAVILGFQNCGKGFQAASSDVPSAAGDPEPCTVNCGPGQKSPSNSFSAGQAFDATKIPYTPMGNLANTAAGYAALSGFKSMAMAANGYGHVAIAGGTSATAYTSDYEASRVALEVCQALSGDQGCAILAEGAIFKYDESVFKTKFMKYLESGTRNFNPLTVPWMTDTVRAGLANYGSSTATFKALALDLYGAGAFRTVNTTQAEATRRAMESCEAYARGRICTLYAVGNSVVFNVTSLNVNTTQTLDFSRTAFAGGAVPFVSDADRTLLTTAYPSFVIANPGAALAIHPNGAWSYQSDAAAALASCKTNAPTDCVIYANGAVVNFTKATVNRAF